MLSRFKSLASTGCILIAIVLPGCQSAKAPSAPPVAASTAASQPAAVAEVPAEELRSVLSDLARAHEQKLQLAAWVAMPFVGPPVAVPIKPFYKQMGERQKDLLTQLQAVARSRHIDLTYHPSTDINGRALAIMEKRQEKLVRSDGAPDFDRDMLMQMYSDYEWQICLLQALLPTVKDPALRAYVEASLKVHEDGSAEIVGFLKKFKFAG